MRQVIIIFLIFVTINLPSRIFAQEFSLVTGTSIGLEINDSLRFQQVGGTFSIQPQFTFGAIDISLIALTLIKDTIPNFLAGSEIGTQVWRSADLRTSLGLTARYLYGSGGRQLLGGGLTYSVDRTTARFTTDWNLREKTVIALIGVSYDLIKTDNTRRRRSDGLLER